MTLGEGKRKVLMLLDEYSMGGEILLDEDLNAKMNDFFDAAQKDMALWQPIVRRASVTLDGSGNEALPPDVSRVLAVRRGERAARGFEIIDGRIVYPAGDSSTLTLDYCAAPRTITPQTEDSHVFEIGEEAANCLPYFVAAQQLVPDLVADYGALYGIYQQMRAMLPRSNGVGGASVRQALWRSGHD